MRADDRTGQRANFDAIDDVVGALSTFRNVPASPPRGERHPATSIVEDQSNKASGEAAPVSDQSLLTARYAGNHVVSEETPASAQSSSYLSRS